MKLLRTPIEALTLPARFIGQSDAQGNDLEAAIQTAAAETNKENNTEADTSAVTQFFEKDFSDCTLAEIKTLHDEYKNAEADNLATPKEDLVQKLAQTQELLRQALASATDQAQADKVLQAVIDFAKVYGEIVISTDIADQGERFNKVIDYLVSLTDYVDANNSEASKNETASTSLDEDKGFQVNLDLGEIRKNIEKLKETYQTQLEAAEKERQARIEAVLNMPNFVTAVNKAGGQKVSDKDLFKNDGDGKIDNRTLNVVAATADGETETNYFATAAAELWDELDDGRRNLSKMTKKEAARFDAMVNYFDFGAGAHLSEIFFESRGTDSKTYEAKKEKSNDDLLTALAALNDRDKTTNQLLLSLAKQADDLIKLKNKSTDEAFTQSYEQAVTALIDMAKQSEYARLFLQAETGSGEAAVDKDGKILSTPQGLQQQITGNYDNVTNNKTQMRTYFVDHMAEFGRKQSALEAAMRNLMTPVASADLLGQAKDQLDKASFELRERQEFVTKYGQQVTKNYLPTTQPGETNLTTDYVNISATEFGVEGETITDKSADKQNQNEAHSAEIEANRKKYVAAVFDYKGYNGNFAAKKLNIRREEDYDKYLKKDKNKPDAITVYTEYISSFESELTSGINTKPLEPVVKGEDETYSAVYDRFEESLKEVFNDIKTNDAVAAFLGLSSLERMADVDDPEVINDINRKIAEINLIIYNARFVEQRDKLAAVEETVGGKTAVSEKENKKEKLKTETKAKEASKPELTITNVDNYKDKITVDGDKVTFTNPNPGKKFTISGIFSEDYEISDPNSASVTFSIPADNTKTITVKNAAGTEIYKSTVEAIVGGGEVAKKEEATVTAPNINVNVSSNLESVKSTVVTEFFNKVIEPAKQGKYRQTATALKTFAKGNNITLEESDPTYASGKPSAGDRTVAWFQQILNQKLNTNLATDGYFGVQTANVFKKLGESEDKTVAANFLEDLQKDDTESVIV